MTLDEIKNLIEADGGKFIIVENGKPTIVIISFEDYKKKLEKFNVNLSKSHNPGSNPGPNKECEGLDEGLKNEKGGRKGEELTIEDLPL